MMSTPLHTVVMLTLDDVLELPTVRRARPRVVAEALPSSTPRTVRWVHTSEIFEIGPLLRGGELLRGVDSAVGAMADIRDGLRMAPAWTVGLRSPTSSTDGVAPPALRVRELALGRLLLARSATADVDDFVERTLGPVLQHDARRRGALLPTLEAYLDAAGNKRSAAAALGIQRQTLYARLARLDELLGADLSEPRTRTSLHVAVLAWRLRTGAAGFRALPDARVASREG